MSYWSGRGLRGSSFEELINMTNDIYFEKGLAVVQKVPTPITPMKMDKEKKVITLAYFEKKSTVDYIGAVQGIPMCFDAKETRQGRLPLQNIHEHQVKFMKKFDEQGGLAFLLVRCNDEDECFLLPVEVLESYWLKAQQGGRKSIPYCAFEEKYSVKNKDGYPVHYLEAVNEYLAQKG